jgi:hypothetical protein
MAVTDIKNYSVVIQGKELAKQGEELSTLYEQLQDLESKYRDVYTKPLLKKIAVRDSQLA